MEEQNWKGTILRTVPSGPDYRAIALGAAMKLPAQSADMVVQNAEKIYQWLVGSGPTSHAEEDGI